MAQEHCLAIDLGAGSGRVMLGSFDGDKIAVEELHRFDNPGTEVLGSLFWDPLRLFGDMRDGIRAAAGAKPVSLGVDTWGVDFALLDRGGKLAGNPYHYRDSSTNGAMAEVFEVISKEEIFEHTGLQFMELNSLFQLYARRDSPALESASSLLMMPDLFHYWFTGEQACEFTDATTSQCYDPRRRAWARPVLEALGLPTGIFGPVIEPGTVLGRVRRSIAEECGVGGLDVIVPGTHDTASAVAAVPAEGPSWAYLSSGTWSLLGVETLQPHVTPAVLAKNLTNEGGVCRTNRLLKNICGLWLLEECRREWSRRGIATEYDKLLSGAEASQPFRSVIDVDDPEFAPPGDMPGRIARKCRATGQPVPGSPGEFARAIFEGLALRYRSVMGDIAGVTGVAPAALHVVGGGSRNQLLSQFAADACGVPVITGPVEATAVGNVLMQGMAAGRIGDLAQGREIVRRSFDLGRYEPNPELAGGWDEAAGRLAALCSG